MGCAASIGKYKLAPEGIIPPDLPKEDRLGPYQLESASRLVESCSKREHAVKVGDVTDPIGDANLHPVVHVLELVMKPYDNEWLLRGRIDLQDSGGPSGWITIAKFTKANGKLKERLAKPCLEEEPGKELQDDAGLVERRRKLRKERAARRAAGGPAEDTTIVLYDASGPYIFCGEYDGKGGCEWLGQHRINIGSLAKGSIVAFNHGNDSIICIYDRHGKKCIFGKYNSEGGCKWYKEHFINIGSEWPGDDNIVAFQHNGIAIVCIHRAHKLFFGKYNGKGGCKWYGEHAYEQTWTGDPVGRGDRIAVFNQGWQAIICIYRPQWTACFFGAYTGLGSCEWYSKHCIGNFSVTKDCRNIVACNHKNSGIICINTGQRFFFGRYNGQGGCDWYKEHYADMGSVADSCDCIAAFNHADDAHICIYDPRKRKCFFGKYTGQGACRWHNQHNTDTGGIDYTGIAVFTR